MEDVFEDSQQKPSIFEGDDSVTEGYQSLIDDAEHNDLSVTTVEVVQNEIKDKTDMFRRSDSNFSTSSLLDSSYCLDEGDDNETRDLFVVVSNPEKHCTVMETYTTFKITTKTTRSEYDMPEYSVRRRYNDFMWLREQLQDTNPGHLIPPLPEKHSIHTLDRFDPPFIKARQAALNRFLCRIADHPVLSFNEHFQTFLTAKAWEFQAYKKKTGSLLGRLTDSLHSISASYMMKNRSPEHVLLGEYIQTFTEKLGNVDRIAQRVVKEQSEFILEVFLEENTGFQFYEILVPLADYLSELREYGPIFTLWQSSEDELALPLQATATAVEKCCKATEDVIQATDKKFTQHVKEYILYGDAIKAVLRRRDAIQIEYEVTLEELNRKKEERERISSQVEVLNDRLVVADADLKADMERWNKNKRRDFRKIFVGMADRQIDYYQKCLLAWEQAIPLIQKTDTDDALSSS